MFGDMIMFIAALIMAKRSSSSLKNGEITTTTSDHILHWDTAHRRQKPSSRWTKDRQCTNSLHGPLKWGCSIRSSAHNGNES